MAAVQRGPDGNLAYVMGADHKITVQPVTIALTQGNIALISDGLQAGEQVVTEGQDKLQAGTLVGPKSPKAAAPVNAQDTPQVAPAGTPQGTRHSTTPEGSQALPRTAENLGGGR
jgi:hypothetical protein